MLFWMSLILEKIENIHKAPGIGFRVFFYVNLIFSYYFAPIGNPSIQAKSTDITSAPFTGVPLIHFLLDLLLQQLDKHRFGDDHQQDEQYKDRSH